MAIKHNFDLSTLKSKDMNNTHFVLPLLVPGEGYSQRKLRLSITLSAGNSMPKMYKICTVLRPRLNKEFSPQI